MSGNPAHRVQDALAVPAGDLLAAKLCAAHADKRHEDDAIDARLSRLADRVAGRRIEAHDAAAQDDALARMMAALADLEACVA